MTELWRLSATELVRLVRTGSVSAREAAKSALERLETVNPLINAIVDHRPETVYEQADRVDRMIARGEDPGLLAGVREAGTRLALAGWCVEEIEDVPLIREAGEVQEQLWFGDGFTALADAVARDGDPGAPAVVAGGRGRVAALPADAVSRALTQRANVASAWRKLLQQYPVLLLPVSSELLFGDELDLEGEAGFRRVWDAQLALWALSAIGLPALTLSTQMIGSIPVGVQIVGDRYREVLCRRAGRAIEALGVPPAPIDPITRWPGNLAYASAQNEMDRER